MANLELRLPDSDLLRVFPVNSNGLVSSGRLSRRTRTTRKRDGSLPAAHQTVDRVGLARLFDAEARVVAQSGGKLAKIALLQWIESRWFLFEMAEIKW